MPDYKAVFFDFGNTLAPLNPVREPERIGLTYHERGFAKHFEIDLPQDQALLELHRRCSDEAGWGRIDGWADGISKFYARWAELLLTALGAPSEAVKLHAADFAKEYRDVSDSTRIVYDDTVETLEKLAEMSLRLAIVSNNDGSLARRVEYIGLTHFFDVVVDSAVVESNKPDAGIFKHAMEAMDVAPADVLHVGDSYAADVEGAAALGIDTAWMPRGNEPPENVTHRPCFVIEELAELPGLIVASR